MTIFNGDKFAKEREEKLKQAVSKLSKRKQRLKIAAVLFQEDAGSRLYTRLKKEAAERVGIKYEVYTFSLKDGVGPVLDQIKILNLDQSITGIIVQKPRRSTWVENNLIEGEPKAIRQAFARWWRLLTMSLDEKKDVDGLHPETLSLIKKGTWKEKGKVLPATCAAVLEILKISLSNSSGKVVILGKSDILGVPLYYELTHLGFSVEMLGSKELKERVDKGVSLKDADIVVSATGRPNLVTGDMVKEGVVVIDVGEPKGDIDFKSVSKKASFITPVPGGVGPVTVVSLLGNLISMVQSPSSKS